MFNMTWNTSSCHSSFGSKALLSFRCFLRKLQLGLPSVKTSEWFFVWNIVPMDISWFSSRGHSTPLDGRSQEADRTEHRRWKGISWTCSSFCIRGCTAARLDYGHNCIPWETKTVAFSTVVRTNAQRSCTSPSVWLLPGPSTPCAKGAIIARRTNLGGPWECHLRRRKDRTEEGLYRRCHVEFWHTFCDVFLYIHVESVTCHMQNYVHVGMEKHHFRTIRSS